MVLPYIQYCVLVWGNTDPTRLSQVVVLQKKCIRIIASENKYEHTTPIFKRFRALKFNDIVYLTSAIMLFRVYVKDVPVNIQKMFVQVHEIHDHNTRQCNDYFQQFSRTKLKSYSFSVQGPKIWKIVSTNIPINKITSINSFKVLMKKYILNGY